MPILHTLLLPLILLASPNVRHSNNVVESPSFSTKSIETSGVSIQAWEEAYVYYVSHKDSLKLSKDVLAIADFSKPSNTERLFLININDGTVDKFKVAHGKGSDPDHNLKMDRFSSQPGSYATPKGFHKMTSIYNGKHGLSLKMQGLEKENKSSESRAIVLHGAAYVSWKHTGRSQGCPAVEKKHTKAIINRLKNGALFYHFNTKGS